MSSFRDYKSGEGAEAAQYVISKLPEAKQRLNANDRDIKLVQDVLGDSSIINALKQQTVLSTNPGVPAGSDAVHNSSTLQSQIPNSHDPKARELGRIMNKPHVNAMLSAHDDVAKGNFYEDRNMKSPPLKSNPNERSLLSPNTTLNQNSTHGTMDKTFSPTSVSQQNVPVIGSLTSGARPQMYAATPGDQPVAETPIDPSYMPVQDMVDPETGVTMIPIFRQPGEPLGLTVKTDNDNLIVARILAGSAVEKQGRLQMGDIILEVNGHEVKKPADLQTIMKNLPPGSNPIVFKIVQGEDNDQHGAVMYVKTHFSYDPERDGLNPCKEAGLAFKVGDVLEITNRSDPNWWQARKISDPDFTGLVPSQTLEEKRKAFVKPEWDMSKSSFLCGLGTKRRKKKMMYVIRRNVDLDKADVAIYEEVACLPPIHRKLIILLGASGVGKTTLKNRLIAHNPNRFMSISPVTSRAPTRGEQEAGEFRFDNKAQMEEDIIAGRYLEWGEMHGHLFGIKLDDIRAAIAQTGKTIVLDLNPQALKIIRTAEFLPFVVFIAAPAADVLRKMHIQSRIDGTSDKDVDEEDFIKSVQESSQMERQFKQYFDKIIINDNMEAAKDRLIDTVEQLAVDPHWLPVSWIY